MLRLNDSLRLSVKDQENLRDISGKPGVPTTVTRYNQQLEQAAADWEGTDCAEGALLAWMALDMQLEDSAELGASNKRENAGT